ncbi:alpha-2-macroglobulin family protein [Magnetococcus sp. PR-3]|uniref:alpha-2-macroglobulin family protein n=1 Tax=Magnetococcus sp. PR-3 TaxID=3120355 RepID=UPI002FCE5D62
MVIRLLILFTLLLGAFPQVLSAAPFKIIQADERLLDGRPALMLRFSHPLAEADQSQWKISVLLKDKPVSGRWVKSEDGQQLYFPFIQPSTRYEIAVEPGVIAKGGELLQLGKVYKIKTQARPPGFNFAANGLVIPARKEVGLPITTVNVPEVMVEFIRVKDAAVIKFGGIFTSRGQRAIEAWEASDWAGDGESVYSGRYRTGGDPNQTLTTNLPIGEIPQLQLPGLYVAVMRRPGQFHQYEASYFFVTDIGLHLRRYGKKQAELFAVSLTDGQPLAHTEITLHREDLKPLVLRTNTQGHVALRSDKDLSGLILARRGKHFAMLPLDRSELDLSEFSIHGPNHQPIKPFLFGPRDLYRPGETALVEVLQRDHDGAPIPKRTLFYQIFRPDGRLAKKDWVLPDAQGYTRIIFKLPDDVQTGQWRVQVAAEQKRPAEGEYRFQVEPFLPERLKLQLKNNPTGATLEKGWQVGLQGDFLYGAPAAGLRADVFASLHEDTHPIPQWPDFFFGNSTASSRLHQWSEQSLTLDQHGHQVFNLPLADFKLQEPAQLRLRVDLNETGGRAVTRTLRTSLWPAQQLVGIRPLYDGDYAPRDKPTSFEVIRTDKKGALLQAQNLQIKVIYEERNYSWVYSDSRGWHHNITKSEYAIHEQDLNLVQGKKATISFNAQWGDHRLEILDPSTGLKSIHRFKAGWSRGDNTPSARPDRVAMTLDKPHYNLGDTVQLSLRPPHAGRTLVMVESDQMLFKKWVDTPAQGTTVEIPVGQSWNRHDLYISTMHLRPHGMDSIRTPTRAVGMLHLPLNRQDRKLALEIDAPTLVEPEQTVQATVRVTGSLPPKTHIRLVAVDVGVLNITRFKTPDPNRFFFEKLAYSGQMHDLYHRVMEAKKGDWAKRRFGGDMDAADHGGPRIKPTVQIVAITPKPIELGADGTAQVALKLPDFNGTLRLMAIAYTDRTFGHAEQEMVVRAPLVMEASTPRFMAPGDRSRLSLDLHNHSEKDQTLILSLQQSGLLETTLPQKMVTLSKGARTTLVLPLQAKPGFGSGTLTIHAKGQGVEKQRQWSIAVRPPYTPTTESYTLALEPGQHWALSDDNLNQLIPGTATLGVTLSNQPPIDAGDAIRNLISYPYGCLEQTSSRMWPLLYVDPAMAKRFGIKKPMDRSTRLKAVKAGFERIAGMQKQSGAFGLWSSRNPEEAWLTAYVVDLMFHAIEQGFSIPKPQLTKALRYLFKRYQQPDRGLTDEGNFAIRSYAAFLLSYAKKAAPGTLRQLYETRPKKMQSPLPFVHLGIAMLRQGQKQRGRELILHALKTPRQQAPNALYDYGSTVRDTAWIYALLHKEKIANLDLTPLLFSLQTQMQGRQWYSTQERFALFQAYRMTRKTQAEAPTYQLITIDPSQKPRIENHSKERKYLRATLSGYAKQAPTGAMQNLHIQRRYYTLEGIDLGEDLSRLKVSSGLRLLVRLTVRKANRHVKQGLIEDMLPAGFEIENPRLDPNLQLPDVTIDGIKLRANQSKLTHQEFLEDRYMAALTFNKDAQTDLFYRVRLVTPGRYLVPGVRVEDMYAPEWQGVMPSKDVLHVLPRGSGDR